MICPHCNGSGRVRKRVLIFFTRWARCPNCLGTGEFPPRVAEPVPRARWRDDDDRDTWGAQGTAAGAIVSGLQDARDLDAQPREDAFEVGSGGRSGGAGATASWGDAPADAAPVIVDPFAGETGAVGSAIAAEAAEAPESGSSSDSSSTDGGDSSHVESGTSY